MRSKASTLQQLRVNVMNHKPFIVVPVLKWYFWFRWEQWCHFTAGHQQTPCQFFGEFILIQCNSMIVSIDLKVSSRDPIKLRHKLCASFPWKILKLMHAQGIVCILGTQGNNKPSAQNTFDIFHVWLICHLEKEALHIMSQAPEDPFFQILVGTLSSSKVLQQSFFTPTKGKAWKVSTVKSI